MEDKKKLAPEAQERANKLFELIGQYGGEVKESLYKFMDTLCFTLDFFEAPASTYYHGNYPGGLYDHSEHVFRRAVQLNYLLTQDRRYSEEAAFRVGMFHDLCKTLFYKGIKKNVKNPETGFWEVQDAYAIEDLFPLGHGEKSLSLYQMYIGDIDPIEALAIRWHMGAYNVSTQRGPQEIIDVWKRFETDPLILLTHIADGLAAHIDENTDNIFFGMEQKAMPEELKIGQFNPQNIRNERVNSIPSFTEGTSDADMYVTAFKMYLGNKPGMEKLLAYICGPYSDFFTAPASERNQFAVPGGLCRVSLRMFSWLTRLVDLLNWPVSMESIAAVTLLHGLGKIKTYKTETRHRKNQDGEWEDYTYISRDEEFPWGDMGAKSVYMIQPFQQGQPMLTREEALAIRWVEGALTGANIKECSAAYEKWPFTFLAHAAYLLACFGP